MIRIVLLPAIIWAARAPGTYGFYSIFFGHWSALIDIVVVLGCVILIVPAFKKIPWTLWLTGLLIVAVASSVGLFHHFRDSGESMPLPFEWLNEYWQGALPLLVLSLMSAIGFNRQTQANSNPLKAEQAACSEPRDPDGRGCLASVARGR